MKQPLAPPRRHPPRASRLGRRLQACGDLHEGVLEAPAGLPAVDRQGGNDLLALETDRLPLRVRGHAQELAVDPVGEGPRVHVDVDADHHAVRERRVLVRDHADMRPGDALPHVVGRLVPRVIVRVLLRVAEVLDDGLDESLPLLCHRVDELGPRGQESVHERLGVGGAPEPTGPLPVACQRDGHVGVRLGHADVLPSVRGLLHDLHLPIGPAGGGDRGVAEHSVVVALQEAAAGGDPHGALLLLHEPEVRVVVGSLHLEAVAGAPLRRRLPAARQEAGLPPGDEAEAREAAVPERRGAEHGQHQQHGLPLALRRRATGTEAVRRRGKRQRSHGCAERL
mmetsp:Transcript_71418/g.159917  ORF Transcript_71418/g.159917 Transcript_71418/m.159917 type:complete len:339 (+) Transcript_71418:1-1017(+)